MTIAKTKTPKLRRRQLVLGIATLGGLVAAGGFLWVAAVAATQIDPFVQSPWDGVSTSPGLAAFVLGSVILLGALIPIRLHVHPRIGGRIIWGSVWIVWVAIALNCFGTAMTTADPFSGSGAVLEVLSFVVGFLTEIVLIVGVAFLILRWMDGVALDRTATQESGGRHRQLVVGVATVFAILGGLLTLGGYFAVAALEQAYMNVADVSHWNVASIDPGMAAFIIGSVALLGALLTIRLHVRPRFGARFIWASAWLFWAAIAANCLGLALGTDPSSGIGSEVVLLSIVVGIPAVVLLIFGIIVFVNRSKKHRQPDRHIHNSGTNPGSRPEAISG